MQPYSEYTIRVRARGFRDFTISGIDVFANEVSVQEVNLDTEDAPAGNVDNIVIPANTLFGNFPPKIPEEEVKTVNETGEIVLSRVDDLIARSEAYMDQHPELFSDFFNANE